MHRATITGLTLAVASAAVWAQEDPQQEIQRLQRYVDGYITQNQQLRAEKEAAERRANAAEAQLRQLHSASPPAPVVVTVPAQPSPAAAMPYIPPLQMNIQQPQRQLRCTSRNVLGTVYTDCN